MFLIKKLSVFAFFALFLFSLSFACVDLAAPATYGSSIVASGNSFYVNSDTVLCPQSYTHSFSEPLFIINSSNLNFNCNESLFTSNDNPSAISISASTENLSIYGTCNFTDFSRLLIVDGNPGASVSNLTFTNLSIFSPSNYGIYLEYTQYSNFSNILINDSGLQAFLIVASSYNNFTNLTIFNSNYEGFYLTSESDSNNITDSNFTDNGRNAAQYGVLFTGSSNNNLVYNNYFNNTNNLYSDLAGNYFNTTKILGSNIVGGSYLGGNYYDDYAGSDTDFDGIGDTQNYSIATIPTYDYLPLVLPISSANISKILLNNSNASSGGLLQYLVNISNNGTAYLTSLSINDSFSPYLSYNSSSYALSSNTSNSSSWLIATNIAPSASYLLYVNLSVNSNATNSTTLLRNVTNLVDVSALSTTGSYANASTSLNSTVYYANLSVSKSVSNSSVIVGQNTTYTINITNPSLVNISVNISDTLDSGLIYNTSNLSPSSSDGQNLIWLVNLSANSSLSFNYVVITNSSGTLNNSVSVLATVPNGNSLSFSNVVSISASAVSEDAPVSSSDESDSSSSERPRIRVSHVSNCLENIVTVREDSEAFADVSLFIEKDGAIIHEGTTNSSGHYTYFDQNGTVYVRVRSEHFGPYLLSLGCTNATNDSILTNSTFPLPNISNASNSSPAADSEPVIDSTPVISPAVEDVSQIDSSPSVSTTDASTSSSAASNSNDQSSSSLESAEPDNSFSSPVLIVVVVLVLGGLFGVYWFIFRR